MSKIYTSELVVDEHLKMSNINQQNDSFLIIDSLICICVINWGNPDNGVLQNSVFQDQPFPYIYIYTLFFVL